MAFLDNSGDIILDAVLTDTGRFRMARGDFRISKFALGDDEIDYSLFNHQHPSGSAYYDLEVLRTPILEAFTNNTSTMKSKLISITRTNLLHLPVLKLLNGGNSSNPQLSERVKHSAVNSTTGGYIVCVDRDTNDLAVDAAAADDSAKKGIFKNDTNARDNLRQTLNSVILERGLDTTEISPNINMPATLRETQFIVEMDHRLGELIDTNANAVPVSFIDDDQIASYYVSTHTSNVVAAALDSHPTTQQGDRDAISEHNIRGPRDTIVQFKIRPSINLVSSTFLFEKLGSTTSVGATIDGFTFGTSTVRFIDTTIRVTSATTSYSINIPIRYVKKVQ